MALSLRELAGLSQASSGQYSYGLGEKSCCESCAHGGPCTGCGGPAGSACRCSGGLGATTVSRGQADLEPGDYGYQYAQTTKPNTTVVGRRQGFVEPDRRTAITREIEELEFLAGTPGVHPRVLAQRVWSVRRKLMGSGDWAWASYADPSSRYDSKEDLVRRLEAVERVLGVGNLSPRMLMAYASGGLGAWGSSNFDPIAKLASCIQGALCMPRKFCCPPGRSPRPEPEYNNGPPPFPPPPPPPFPPPPPPQPSYGQPPHGQPPPPYPPPHGQPPQPKDEIVGIPGGGTPIPSTLIPKQPISMIPSEPTRIAITTPGSYQQLVSALPQAKPGNVVVSTGPGALPPTRKAVTAGAAPQPQIVNAPRPKPAPKSTPSYVLGTPQPKSASSYVVGTPQPKPGSWEWHQARTPSASVLQAQARARMAGQRRGGAMLATGGGTAVSMGGLGGLESSPAINALRSKLAQTRRNLRGRA